jgi:hypothetical protein
MQMRGPNNAKMMRKTSVVMTSSTQGLRPPVKAVTQRTSTSTTTSRLLDSCVEQLLSSRWPTMSTKKFYRTTFQTSRKTTSHTETASFLSVLLRQGLLNITCLVSKTSSHRTTKKKKKKMMMNSQTTTML